MQKSFIYATETNERVSSNYCWDPLSLCCLRRTMQLEERLDNLVGLLVSHGVPVESVQAQDVFNLHAASTSDVSANPSYIVQQWLDGTQAAFGGTIGKIKTPSSTPPVTSWFCIDPREANELLLEFRNSMASQFPFVVVRPHETSASLRSKKPFLWKAIMTAASHQNLDRQVAMGKAFTEEFSFQILIHAKKSLDMLQGLLVHIAWYVFLIIFPCPL